MLQLLLDSVLSNLVVEFEIRNISLGIMCNLLNGHKECLVEAVEFFDVCEETHNLVGRWGMVYFYFSGLLVCVCVLTLLVIIGIYVSILARVLGKLDIPLVADNHSSCQHTLVFEWDYIASSKSLVERKVNGSSLQ